VLPSIGHHQPAARTRAFASRRWRRDRQCLSHDQ